MSMISLTADQSGLLDISSESDGDVGTLITTGRSDYQQRERHSDLMGAKTSIAYEVVCPSGLAD